MTRTSGGGSITAARLRNWQIFCAGRLKRFVNEADTIGDPSLLRDGLTHGDRTALETYRDARAAMALIREAIEDCAPPGSVAREDYLRHDPAQQPAAGRQPDGHADAAALRAVVAPCTCPRCGARMIIIEVFARGCQPRYRPTPAPTSMRIDTS
jgi:hypothetical protein